MLGLLAQIAGGQDSLRQMAVASVAAQSTAQRIIAEIKLKQLFRQIEEYFGAIYQDDDGTLFVLDPETKDRYNL